MKELIKNVQKWFSDQKAIIMQDPFKWGVVFGAFGTLFIHIIWLIVIWIKILILC